MSLIRVPISSNPLIRSRLAGPVRHASGHGGYQYLPFKLPGEKKARFAFKVFAFFASGFSIPFLASAYQLKKAAGGT